MAYLESGGSFGPRMVLVMDYALERAWAKASVGQACAADGMPLTREMLAERIVALAHQGDHNPLMMAEKALTELQGVSYYP